MLLAATGFMNVECNQLPQGLCT